MNRRGAIVKKIKNTVVQKKTKMILKGDINKGDVFKQNQGNKLYEVRRKITRSNSKDSSNGIWYRVKVKDSKCDYWELSDSMIRNLKEYTRVYISKNKIKFPKRKRKQNKNTKQKKRKQNIHWDKTVQNWPRIGDDYQASIPMLMTNLNLNLTFKNVNETIDDMMNFINILKNRV